MRPNRHLLSILVVMTVVSGAGLSADAPLPVIDGREVVASVNGAPITLDAFADALSRAHQGTMRSDQPVPRQNPDALLDRLIGVELVVQEAENIGLDELPGMREALDAYRVEASRTLLLGRQAGRITTPDEQQVDRLFQERVREVRVASIMVDSEEQAVAARSRLDSGEEFATLAREALEAGTPNPNDPERYVKFEKLLPAVRDAVSKLTPGQVSPVIPVQDKFTLVQLIDIRFPGDPALREQIAQAVLKAQQDGALRQYAEDLRDELTTIDEELLTELDFSVDGPGLEQMRADERIVGRVEGGSPVNVGELTRAMEKNAFHGAQRAVEKGKFDTRKHAVLQELLKKRAIDLEAERLKITESEEYHAMVEKRRKDLLFGAFLERAIDASIKVERREVEAYLAEHAAEYSTPEMIRLDSIAFDRREEAEAALDNLNRGADFQWMLANAEGQTNEEDNPGVLRFDGKMPIVSEALPDDLRKAVAGVQTGDVRFYAAEDGISYVLVVREVVPSQPQEFDTVQGTVFGKVVGQKRQAAFDEWVAALREASEIEIFGSSEVLLRALGMGAADHD